MRTLRTYLALLFVFVTSIVFGQDLTQVVRGKIIDKDTRQTIIGANVIIVGSNPIQGASTDTEGKFEIKNVPVGRVSIKITALGYQTQLFSNIVTESAKETVLDVELIESFETLNQVVVTADNDNGEAINEMALISAKQVTVEETGRYAGSLNDPARSVSSFAGVVGDAEGNNDIVVRGNSPRGILWRLEGVEIPNPNHFANEGSTGGPVNTLNATMLANSDFFSGAFAPEYGNALSGVFDTKFRTGNNQKSERSFSIGVLGTDVTLEGPFSKKYNGSYLVNYRYSTLELMDRAGILDFGGVPRYQDASFKINLPTKKAGVFSLFGLGGMSAINQSYEDQTTGEVFGENEVRDALGVVGLNHHIPVGKKSYIHSYVAVEGTKNQFNESLKDTLTNESYTPYKQNYKRSKIRLSTSFNHKFNSKNKINIGTIYSLMNYNMNSVVNPENTVPKDYVNASGNTSVVQAYATWKHRFTKELTMVGGVHYTQLFLNNNYSIEPRLGLKWDMTKRNYLTLGFGLHSRLESISVYLANVEDEDNTYGNKDLELTKSVHLVAGFGHYFTPNLVLKSEVYYQHLYDVPVESDPNSSFSMINESSSYIDLPLVSKGTGENYGLELTLESYFHKLYYFMVTSSLYQSKYTALDNQERDSKYNANYAANVVVGKEFKLKSKKKNMTIGVNLKGALLGGNRYTPINLEQSITAGKTVFDEENVFGAKNPDLFFMNLGVTYRVNSKKVTHEIKLDIQNVTNNQAAVGRYYNDRNKSIEEYYQLALVPNLMYTIKF